MGKYRVLETSFIDNKLVKPGEIVEYEGEASGNLKAVSKKEADAAEAAEANDGQQA